MNKSDSIKELAGALAKAQANMPAAKFDATNPFLKNKYASLGAIIEAARKPLADNGLSISQLPINDGETIGVTTILMHNSGEWIESTLTLPVGEERGKSTAQVAGSVITYLRRYALASVLGIYADEDTDGNQQEKKATASKQEASTQTPSIVYPPELAVVTDRQGKPYVDIDDDTLGHMLRSITNELNKPHTDEEKATYSMKAQVIREILALRKAG